ncbi:hypothetical protein AB0D61_50945, partial [Streptomyces sp. NPDC048341]
MTLWESHDGRPSVTGNYNVMGLTSVSASDLKPGRDSESTTHGYGDDLRALRHHSAKASTSAPGDTAASSRVTPAMRTLDTAASMVRAPQA